MEPDLRDRRAKPRYAIVHRRRLQSSSVTVGRFANLPSRSIFADGVLTTFGHCLDVFFGCRVDLIAPPSASSFQLKGDV